MNFPDENRERELEVVKGEDDELLLPLLGGEDQLPVDQTRLYIKNINLTEIWYHLDITFLLETDKMQINLKCEIFCEQVEVYLL